jgi:RNA polymerase sigma-70 factor, ECF subfamily
MEITALTDSDFSEQYEHGYRTTIKFLLSRGVKQDKAEEIAQAAWVRGWEKRAQLREIDLLPTWVNTIAWNLIRTSYRHEPRTEELFSSCAVVPERTVYLTLAANEVLERVKQSERIVLEAFFLQGLSIKELAEQNGWTETALRMRLHRARVAAQASIRRKAKRPSRAHLKALVQEVEA